MKTFLQIVAASVLLLASPAVAQVATATVTNAFEWNPSPGAINYDVIITTNKVAMSTNGYNPPATAIIESATTPGTKINITAVWSGITNGTFSVFVKARDTFGMTSLNSIPLLFQMNIPPSPPTNVRIVAP